MTDPRPPAPVGVADLPAPHAWDDLDDDALRALAARTIELRDASTGTAVLDYDGALYRYLVRTGREWLYLKANRETQLKHVAGGDAREDRPQ